MKHKTDVLKQHFGESARQAEERMDNATSENPVELGAVETAHRQYADGNAAASGDGGPLSRVLNALAAVGNAAAGVVSAANNKSETVTYTEKKESENINKFSFTNINSITVALIVVAVLVCGTVIFLGIRKQKV